MAVTFLITVVVFFLVSAILMQISSSSRLIGHRASRIRAEHLAESGINVALRARQANSAMSWDTLLALYGNCQVGDRAGYRARLAGDYVHSEGYSGLPAVRASVMVELKPTAYEHIVVADRSLTINGSNPELHEPPHEAIQDTTPKPTSGFHDYYKGLSRSNGIYLPSDPFLAEFRPGGGTWSRTETIPGKPVYTYQGGGRGEEFGWTPGTMAWGYQGAGVWLSTNGDRWTHPAGAWSYSGNFDPATAPTPQTGQSGRVLPGVIFVDAGEALLNEDTLVNGAVVTSGGAISIDKATVWVIPDEPAPKLALAAISGGGNPGNIMIESGASKLGVGATTGKWDDAFVPETGGLVYAEGSFEKNGTMLHLNGIIFAGSVTINGAASSEFLYDPTVASTDPEGLDLSGDVFVVREMLVGEPFGLSRQ